MARHYDFRVPFPDRKVIGVKGPAECPRTGQLSARAHKRAAGRMSVGERRAGLLSSLRPAGRGADGLGPEGFFAESIAAGVRPRIV